MKVTVVDYGMGNLASVANALRAVGAEPDLCADAADLGRAERIILPGVGAFGDAMHLLAQGGWIDALHDAAVRDERPVLGLCLGMQLMFERSAEHGDHVGLGWLPGRVERLAPSDPALLVPHMGWNDVQVQGGILYADLEVDPVFYFVHSYVVVPSDPAIVTGTFEYGGTWTASVESGNLFATQYHPEKSHRAGLAALARFVER